MKEILFALSIILLFAMVACEKQKEGQDDTNSIFKITKLNDHIYQLTSDQGAYTTNTLVSVGDDGVLIVDTQTEDEAEELKKFVDSLGKGIPKYIINTHRHVEHIGGNAIFGPEPVKIGHHLLKEKLTSGSFLFYELDESTLPSILVNDSMEFDFNGEKIKIIEMGGSHDDNEIIVHFTKSKIVHLSSLVNGFNFPSIDNDGNIFKFAPILEKAKSLLPNDVIIVSGHNDNGTYDQFAPYLEMINGTIATVKKALDEGKTVEQMKEENILAKWESYAGSYVSVNDWIDYIVDGFQRDRSADKLQIYDPLYNAYKEGGIDKAESTFNELKEDTAKYEILGYEFVSIGNKYQKREKYDEAIGFYNLYLKYYPEGDYNYYTYYLMAKSYKALGNIDKAIECCEKTLELKPDTQAAKDLLEELRNK